MLHPDLTTYHELLEFRSDDDGHSIYDPVRRSWYKVQPEELVRQTWIRMLHAEYGLSYSTLAVEKEFKVDGRSFRYDLVYFLKGEPHILFEFKSFNHKLTQEIGLQIANYNRSLNVPYLLISNGQESYLYYIDFEADLVTGLDKFPF